MEPINSVQFQPRTVHDEGPEGGIEVYLYSFFNLGARCGWVVNATHRPLYHRERPGTRCIGSWVDPGPVWKGAENLARTGIRSPDRPARSSVAVPTELSGPS